MFIVLKFCVLGYIGLGANFTVKLIYLCRPYVPCKIPLFKTWKKSNILLDSYCNHINYNSFFCIFVNYERWYQGKLQQNFCYIRNNRIFRFDYNRNNINISGFIPVIITRCQQSNTQNYFLETYFVYWHFYFL